MAGRSEDKVVEMSDGLPYLRHRGATGGPGGGGDDMEARISKLEIDGAVAGERVQSMRVEMERRFDGIERKLDKLPGEWAMAKVVFFVVGALMTAAIWGPRALSLLSPASP